MISTGQVLYSFAAILGILLCCFLTGYFLKGIAEKLTKAKAIIAPYWLLYGGLFFWVSIYAIICTKGLTMLFPVPFLIVWIFAQLVRSPFTQSNTKNQYTTMALALITQFGFFLWTLSSFDVAQVKYIAGDFSIYYRMADRLNTFGVEAYNFNIDLIKGVMPSPYHYGDLWCYAIVSKLVGSNPSVTFLVAFTVLSVIFTAGIYEYVLNLFRQQLAGKTYYLYFLIFAGLFAGFQFCFPAFVRRFAEPYTLSIFNWGKVMVLSTSLIGLLILIRHKSWTTLTMAAVIAGLLYLNALPAIYGAVFLLLLICLFLKQITGKQWFVLNARYIGLVAVVVLLLYKGVPVLMHAPKATNAKEPLLHGASVGQYLKTTINIFIGGWFQLLTIAPYLLVLAIGLLISDSWKGLKSKLQNIDYSVLFLLLMFVSGMASWAALHFLSVDTVQFFHNILAPVYAISISLIVFYTIIIVKKRILSVLIILLSLVSVGTSSGGIFYAWSFDHKEWNMMRDFFKADPSETTPFINIRSIKELNYWSAKKTDQYIPLSILSYRWHNYHNISMNTPFIPINENSAYAFEEKTDIAGATFTMYYEKCKKQGITDIDAQVRQFIDDHKVRYVSVSMDTTLPGYLRSSMTDSVALPHAHYIIYKIN